MLVCGGMVPAHCGEVGGGVPRVGDADLREVWDEDVRDVEVRDVGLRGGEIPALPEKGPEGVERSSLQASGWQ